MKRIYCFLVVLFIITDQPFAQTDAIKNTIAVFPYQHPSEAEAAFTKMQQWDKADWKAFLTLLDGTDSTQLLRSTHALSAYVNHIAGDVAIRKQTAIYLSSALGYLQSFNARNLVISYLGLSGDDATVPALAKLLKDETYAGNAARALAVIHSEIAVAALSEALKKSKAPISNHIQAALDYTKSILPKINAVAPKSGSDPNETQLLLALQDRMEGATNPLEKHEILWEASRLKTFPALMLLGNFFYDAELAPDAAIAVARMALINKDLKGKAVRTVLEKALPLIHGDDSAFLVSQLQPYINAMPYDHGYESIFNGMDLTGWKALVGNPLLRAKMTEQELSNAEIAANEKTKGDWIVKDGLLIFTGHGDNLATTKQYGDFDMYVDWKITAQGDAGIYLRGSPQVQIWDTSRREVGAQVGSGGLYNNQKNESKPLVVADNAIGAWNTFHIIMKGEKVTVYLNGILVTDNVVLENYWDRTIPIFSKEQIELQAHGTYVAYRNIYVKELAENTPAALSEEEKKAGFTMLFDGTDMAQWTGDTSGYQLEDGAIVVHPEGKGAGNLYTKEEYADFEYRFEFQLTPGANNGLGIRAPLEGDAAYVGMELQILDNEAAKYKDLQPYQYHGSVYGVIPAKRGYLLPTGEWNKETVIVKGAKVKVILNGNVILDGDIKAASVNGTMDKHDHPGLKRTTGHIGFLGHGDVVRFRNIRVKRL